MKIRKQIKPKSPTARTRSRESKLLIDDIVRSFDSLTVLWVHAALASTRKENGSGINTALVKLTNAITVIHTELIEAGQTISKKTWKK